MKTIISALIFYFFFISNLFSQSSIGEWNDYYYYFNIKCVTASDEFVYGAAENGLLQYDKTNKTITKLTKVDGLSETGISCIAYNVEYEHLMIVYENSNIDILRNDTIFNIPDIKNKQLQGNTKTNSITFKDNYAFLSTGFGIVKINSSNFEIVENYIIGDGATKIEVFQFSFDLNYYYAATENGLYKADIESLNLVDYRNWTLITELPNYNYKINSLANFANKILVMQLDLTDTTCKLLKYENNLWSVIKDGLPMNAKIFATDNKYAVIDEDIIYLYNLQDINFRNIEYFYLDYGVHPNWVFFDKTEIIIGDKNEGIIVEDNNLSYSKYFISSPYSTFGEIYIDDKKLLVAGGGKTITDHNKWTTGQYCELIDGKWNNYINQSARDYLYFAVDKANNNHFFIGAWAGGIYEYMDNTLINTYTNENSVISDWFGNTGVVRISGIEYDQNGNLWLVNASKNPLNVLTNENKWETFDFDGKLGDRTTGNLIINSAGYKCFQVEGQEIFIFDDNGTIGDPSDDNMNFVPLLDDEGKIGNKILSMEIDNKDNIWIGTDEGVAVIYNSENALDEDYTASRVLITGTLNDTTLFTNHLLKTNSVTAIAIDGSNRKWFGTLGSGVYLMSETGTIELQHFDKKNSPLPSNSIISIGIDNSTGIVYFSTEKGLVSYKGDAIKGKDDYSGIYVYPNPVRETYTGLITITGLVSKSNVKITDIAGNLVYEIDTEGGQVVWDGNNFDGKRVSTGVYLIFCSNEDATKTGITKLLFIN